MESGQDLFEIGINHVRLLSLKSQLINKNYTMSKDNGISELSDALESSNVEDKDPNCLLTVDVDVKKIKNKPGEDGKTHDKRGAGNLKIFCDGQISVWGKDRTGNAILLTQVLKAMPGDPKPNLE